MTNTDHLLVIYKDMIRLVASRLKEAGFHRTGVTFFKSKDHNSAVIEFQRSVKSTANEIIFTINLGIISGDLIESWQSRKPNATDAHLKIRLGRILPAE